MNLDFKIASLFVTESFEVVLVNPPLPPLC